MNTIDLYASPGACSKILLILLEEIGVPYNAHLVRFMKGEHKSADYKKINPKGKVPAMVFDGEPLTENPAIISFLAESFPQAKLMPQAKTTIEKFAYFSDLCFCSSTLHPIVTRIRMPQFFSAPEHMQTIWEKGCEAMDEYFQLIEERLSNAEWWYGSQWSAVDAYIYWIFWRVAGANYDTSRFPKYEDHAKRMEQRPAVQRAIACENDMQATLEKEGLLVKPPVINKS